MKFTGKERDGETGLDWFEARYYSGPQGRFTSVDPFNPVDELIGSEFDDYLSNPQYWNKYAYSLNNPLKYKDSDGALPHAVVGGLVGGGIGGALELYSQIRSSQDINWAKVATKTGVGAALGATAAATFGGSLVAQGLSLGIVNTGAGIADRALDADSGSHALDPTAIRNDAVIGVVAGAVGGLVGKQVQSAVQNSAAQKLNERLADHAVRATAQRSASRQAAAREMQKQVAHHPEAMGRRAAGTGRAAAKAATTAAAQRAAELLKSGRKRKNNGERAMREPAAVLFVARYKWPFRAVAVGFVALLAVLRPSVSETWRESGWFFGIAVIVAYGFAVSGLLEMFVRQTWLTERGIFQRSMFGTTRFISYDQVRELVIHREEALLVKCRDNRQLKVHAKEGDPEAIIEAMRRFLNPEIRVITV